MFLFCCLPAVGCYLRLTPNANSDAGTILGQMNETDCIQACLALYPGCVAVDYRNLDSVCFLHGTVSNRKWNACCQRYELTCSGCG
jgi:hypothetical protein